MIQYVMLEPPDTTSAIMPVASIIPVNMLQKSGVFALNFLISKFPAIFAALKAPKGGINICSLSIRKIAKI